MPALILAFCDNGTVVDYVNELDNEARLDMVSAFRSPDCIPTDEVLYRGNKLPKD